MGGLTKSKKLALASDRHDAVSKPFQIKHISMKIDEITINLNEMAIKCDELKVNIEEIKIEIDEFRKKSMK